MQANLYIILIFHFGKQIRDGKIKLYELYKHQSDVCKGVSDLEGEPSSGLACISVNENLLQKSYQHQKQSSCKIVFYSLDQKS